jgi:hypothetical protein
MVDLVAMAEKKPLPLHGDNSRTGVYLRPEPLAEDGSHVKIMVAFKIHKSAAAMHQRLKRIQHFIKLMQRVRRETQPEIEQVAHYEQGFRVSLKLAKKPQQQAVIPVVW